MVSGGDDETGWREVQRLLFARKLRELAQRREVKSESTTDYVKYLWGYARSVGRTLPGDNADHKKGDDISNVSKYIRGESPLPKKDLTFWFEFFNNPELKATYYSLRFKDRFADLEQSIVEELRRKHGVTLVTETQVQGVSQQRQIFEALTELGVPNASSFVPGQNAHFGGRLGTSVLVEFFDDEHGVSPSTVSCELTNSPPQLPPQLKEAFDELADEEDDRPKCFVHALHFRPLDNRERYRVVFGRTTWRLARAWRKLRAEEPDFAAHYYDQELTSLLDLSQFPMLTSIDAIPETSDEKLYLSLRSEWAHEAPSHIHGYGETIEPDDFDVKRNALDLEPVLTRLLVEELGLGNQSHVVRQAAKRLFGVNFNLTMPSLQFFTAVKFSASADEIVESAHRRDKETKSPVLLDFHDPKHALDLVVDGQWTRSGGHRHNTPVYSPCRMLLLHLTRRKFSDQEVLKYLRSRRVRGQLASQ